MSIDTLTLYGTYTVETCCNTNCGVQWAMPRELVLRLRRSHAWFCCPHGHSQHYAIKSDLEIERDKAAQLARQLELQEHRTAQAVERESEAIRSRNAVKGHLTRVHKRVAHGVCPVPGCKRTVKQLADHIRDKHLGYVTTT